MNDKDGIMMETDVERRQREMEERSDGIGKYPEE